jgi:Flp pilus assembly protein TadG
LTAHSQRGSTAITVVILTPMLLTLLSFVVFVGRLSATEGDVRAATHDAARAASLRPTAAAGAADADATARASLSDRTVSCHNLTITTTTRFTGGLNAVHVELRCTMDIADLTGFAVPGHRTITAEATEVLDRYSGNRP